MSETIRVDDDTHAAPSALKGDDETYDDVIAGRIERRREAIRDGAGLWGGPTPPKSPEGTETDERRRRPVVAFHDSSVLIDYLAARDAAVDYVEERAVASPLVLFEAYRGEVFGSGPADFDAVDDALEWVEVVDETRRLARGAAELQRALARSGRPLAARDAFIAGTAAILDERFVVADPDFDVPGITDEMDVDFRPDRA